MSLSVNERLKIAERWLDVAPEGFLVVVHVGHTCQEESRQLAAHAAERGAAAIGEIGPVFYRPASVQALADYIAATASAAPDLPYYYYHMPSMNQVEFPMAELLSKVSGIPNFAGIKYTFEDLDDYERCVQFEGGQYDVLFGRDELLQQALQRGATGAVGSTYNFMAPIYHRLIQAHTMSDEDEAQRMQDLSIATIKLLIGTGSFFSAAKAVMGMIGFQLGAVRRPLNDLSEATRERLEEDLHQVGVWEFLNKKA
jgi:N-acetylneuraminate lyase